MVDVNKLKGRIVEKGLTVGELAAIIGIDKTTIYRKLKGNGDDFSISEADSIAKALSLNSSEATAIFFSQYVA